MNRLQPRSNRPAAVRITAVAGGRFAATLRHRPAGMNRIAHAYCSMARGHGTTLQMPDLARSLNCGRQRPGPHTGPPGGVCEICHSNHAGERPRCDRDLTAAAPNAGVDNIVELNTSVPFRTGPGRWKVY